MHRFILISALLLAPTAWADEPAHAVKPKTVSTDTDTKPERKYVELPGQNGLKLEIEGTTRRVIVPATVVLREGSLELLATKKGAKEHESILAVSSSGEAIHTLLLAAGADIKKARPFKGGDTKVIPKGSKVKVTLRYNDGTKDVEVPAQQWIRDAKTKKTLAEKWVFTGSKLLPPAEDSKDKRPRYGADIDGDFFSLSNFEASILDLPIESSSDNSNLSFEANTDKIPKEKTPVSIVLEVEKE